MSDCGVCLGSYDGDCEFYSARNRIARKPHVCEECGGSIVPGQPYEYVWGKCEGIFWTAKTCLVCAEIAKAFSCNGRMHGVLWDDMHEVMGALNTSCFDRLTTPEAKAELRRRWMEWKGLVA